MLAFHIVGSLYGACLPLSKLSRFDLDRGSVHSLTDAHLEADGRPPPGHIRRPALLFRPHHRVHARCGRLYHDVCSDAARVASSSVSKGDGGPNMSNIRINGRTHRIACVLAPNMVHAPSAPSTHTPIPIAGHRPWDASYGSLRHQRLHLPVPLHHTAMRHGTTPSFW